MRYFKLFILQASAIGGLVLGSQFAPERPLYPTVPTELQSEFIRYTELNIVLVLGFFAAICSVIVGKLLKQSTISSLIATLVAGIFLGSIDYIRQGSLPQFHLPSILACACGSMALFGIFMVCNDIFSSTSKE